MLGPHPAFARALAFWLWDGSKDRESTDSALTQAGAVIVEVPSVDRLIAEEAGSQVGARLPQAANVPRCQFADRGTRTPPDTWCGFPLFDGRTSKSKMLVGM